MAMKAVLLGTQPKPPMASFPSTSSVVVSPAGAGPPKLCDLVKNNASTTSSLTSPNTFGVLEQDPQGPDSLMLPPASLSSMNPTGTATISTAAFSQEQKGAAMLLSFAAIVTKEIDSPEGVNWEDADDQGRHQHLLQHHSRLHSRQPSLPSLSPTKVPSLQEFLRKKRASSALRIRAFESIQDGPANTSGRSDWSRIRAVSIDDVEEHSPASEEEQDADISDGHDDDHAGISVEGKMTLGPKRHKASRIVSPMSSPVTRKLPVRKSTLRNIGRKRRKTPKLPPIGPIKNGSSSNISGNRRKANANTSNNTNTNSHSNATTSGTSKGRQSSKRRVLQPNAPPKTESVKTILRKKFSWKNYPELEAFLIANREEYLRHSALNYTVQQKQYNNKLTERLLELASEHGYVFDTDTFSFVTVRDRIRCYFKSYVQSAKKRGLIIGYAARKAGLLTEDDLEKSAGITGQIVTPASLVASSSGSRSD